MNKTVKILITALKKACKFIRENPPADIEAYNSENLFKALIAGADEPDGEEYIYYFLDQALIDMGE